MADLNEIGQKPKRFEEHETKPKGIKLFFGEKEAKFFHAAGSEITEDILQESFLLYRIDLKTTKTHRLYAEAKKKEWLPEIQIFARINVEVQEPTQHMPGGPAKKGFGNFTAHIYVEHLEELGLVERKGQNEIITGIKMGDFTAFKGQYYKIYDDGYSQISNQYSWAGDRKFFISIKGVEVDEDIFKAR